MSTIHTCTRGDEELGLLKRINFVDVRFMNEDLASTFDTGNPGYRTLERRVVSSSTELRGIDPGYRINFNTRGTKSTSVA